MKTPPRSEAEFEREVPQGDPEAVTCRWCGKGRVRLGKALACVDCDLTERLM